MCVKEGPRKRKESERAKDRKMGTERRNQKATSEVMVNDRYKESCIIVIQILKQNNGLPDFLIPQFHNYLALLPEEIEFYI